MRKISSYTLVLMLCSFWLASCRPLAEIDLFQTTQVDWETPPPEEAGINGEILAELVSRIASGEFQNVHSILIIRDGKLVFEQYFPGYVWDWDADQFQGEFTEFDAETLHSVMSVSKVFTSTLAGIALEKGFINDLDQTVLTYFPEHANINAGRKEAITLDHLLTMTSGLEWNGIEIPVSTRDPRNDIIQMHLSTDPVAYVLNKALITEPGTQWYYSNGDVTLLGETIRDAAGLPLDKFTEQHLFDPLDITEYRWRTIGESDVIAAGGGLEMRPRDMAKLGLLYLNGGVWNGEQIIPAEWIEQATSNQVQMPYDWLGQLFGNGYGYYWWLPEYQTEAGEYVTYTAAGWGGQRISVFPSLDMVVVITGGNYLGPDPADEIMEEFILPAVEQAP